MAIAFQSATNAALTGASLTQTSLAINKPTSTAAGDLLVTGAAYILGQTFNTLSGWTLVGTASAPSGEETKLFCRVCDGTEGSSFTWTFTTDPGSAASLVAMACLRFSGASVMSGSIIGQTASAQAASATSGSPAQLSNALTPSLAIACCGVRPDTATNPVLTGPSTSGWVTNANAKTVSTVSATSFNAAIAIAYNIGTPSVASPAFTTTTANEYGIMSAEFRQDNVTPQRRLRTRQLSAIQRSSLW